MKKQIILAATVAAAVLISCSKQDSKLTSPAAPADNQQMTNQVNLPYIDPLRVGLVGRFEFNSNLKDLTGKLQDGKSSIGTAWYTYDRKGNAKSAIKFDGKYAVGIVDVPHAFAMSLSAWVKFDNPNQTPCAFLKSQSDGPSLMQAFNQLYGFTNPGGNPYVASGVMDTKWHHLAVTTDGVTVKFYVDAVLKGSVVSPDFYNDAVQWYNLGYGSVAGKYWFGAMDDVRFYTRTLSESDVTALYNL